MPYRGEPRWNFLKGILPWLLWAAAFFALEFRGLKKGRDGAPPLTYVLRRYVPGWLTFMGIGWLIFHFLQVYLVQ